MNEAASEVLSWHSATVEEALRQVGSLPAKLSWVDAKKRLEEHGPNLLPQSRRRSLLAQFNNPADHPVAGAGNLTAAIGHWLDAAVILLAPACDTFDRLGVRNWLQHATSTQLRDSPL
ncbi:MAG: cation-transporting P-type ATPase [Pseudomonadota bacterium]